jgi:hypothetical protein
MSMVLLVVAVWPAMASTGRRRDARDNGRGHDIKVIRHGHGAHRLRHTIETYKPWSTRAVRCKPNPCRAIIDVYFTTDSERDDDYERVVQIYKHEGELRASIHKYWYDDEDCVHDPAALLCDSGSKYIGDARVWRSNRSSVTFSLPRKKLRRRGNLKIYGWRATLFDRRKKPCRGSDNSSVFGSDYMCVDYAPERTWVWHRL